MVYIFLWCVAYFNTLTKVKKIRNVVVFLLSLFGFFLIVFRGETIDRDYHTYIEYINNIQGGEIPTLGGAFFDFLVSTVLYLRLPVFVIFVFYALSLPIKVALFFKIKENISCVFLVYVGFFLYLHDFTQIRVSLALSIAYWTVYSIVVLRCKFIPILLSVLSVMIHPSLFLFFIISIVVRWISIKWLTAILVFCVVSSYFDLFNALLNGFVTYTDISILITYQRLAQENVDVINTFGLFPLLNLSIAIIIGFIHFKGERSGSKWIELMMKYMIVSQILWFSLSAIPAFSGRLSQLFLFSTVFIIPYLSLHFTRKAYILSAIYSLIGFVAFLYKGHLLSDYQSLFYPVF